MAIIKATINLNTNGVFQNLSNINGTATEQINGDSELENLVIAPNSSETPFTLLTADPGNVVYFYAQSNISNTSNLEIRFSNTDSNSQLVGLLVPGDFIWVPLAAYGANISVQIKNLDVTNSAKVSVFYGNRG